MYVNLPCSFRILGMHSALDYHWDSSFQFLGESHPDWETVCVLDGQVEVAEDDKIYILKAGDYICHGSMEFHRIRSSGGTTPHVLIICFKHEGTMPPALLDGVFSLNPAELENYQRLFEKLYSYCHGEITDPYASTEIASALGNFFIQLSRKQTRSSRRSQSRTAMEFQRLVKAMQESVCENLSLQELSVRTGLSVSTMKNLFHTYTGISPKAYYTQMRGLEALRFLEGNWDINQIVEKMRYSSPNYFSVSFKQQFGVPPGKYRKAHFE